jgi:hypothetical protein
LVFPQQGKMMLVAQSLTVKEMVFQLRKDFPASVFTYVDVYSLKYSLFNEPEKYGIIPLELH